MAGRNGGQGCYSTWQQSASEYIDLIQMHKRSEEWMEGRGRGEREGEAERENRRRVSMWKSRTIALPGAATWLMGGKQLGKYQNRACIQVSTVKSALFLSPIPNSLLLISSLWKTPLPQACFSLLEQEFMGRLLKNKIKQWTHRLPRTRGVRILFNSLIFRYRHNVLWWFIPHILQLCFRLYNCISTHLYLGIQSVRLRV